MSEIFLFHKKQCVYFHKTLSMQRLYWLAYDQQTLL